MCQRKISAVADQYETVFSDDATLLIEKLEQENAALKADLDRKSKYHWCLYCGHEFLAEGATAEQLQDHILSCPKHPLPVALREIENLRAKLERAEKALGDSNEYLEAARANLEYLRAQLERAVTIVDEAITVISGIENAYPEMDFEEWIERAGQYLKESK